MQTASSTPQANTLRIGRIAKVYPEKHVVDVVFLDDGGFASGVAVSTQWGSQDHGFSYMPKVGTPPEGQWSVELGGDDCLALIGYFSGMPFVVGTVFPAPCGDMALPLNNLMIKNYVGSYLHMNHDGVVTLAARMRLGGEEGHGGGNPTVLLQATQDYAVMFNNRCSVAMDKTGAVEVISGGDNKIKMVPSGAIEITSGGGAVIKMGAGGVIEFNPVDPNAPV